MKKLPLANVKEKSIVAFKKAKPYLVGATMALAIIAIHSVTGVAFAEGEEDNAKTIIKWVIKILGGMSVVGGLVVAAGGVVAFGEAKADGEGPAMAKARNQITAGIVMIALGGSLTAFGNTLAGMVNDNLFKYTA